MAWPSLWVEIPDLDFVEGTTGEAKVAGIWIVVPQETSAHNDAMRQGGNLKSKTIGANTTFYTWSADNRLLTVKAGERSDHLLRT